MAAKYVKLGKKARSGSFYEANTGISLYGEKIMKVPQGLLKHPRVAKAINAGHVILVDEEAYNEFKENNADVAKAAEKAMERHEPKKASKKAEKVEDTDEEEEEVDYMEMNKKPLIKYALTLEGMEFSEEELEGMTKAEIQEEIAAILEGEED